MNLFDDFLQKRFILFFLLVIAQLTHSQANLLKVIPEVQNFKAEKGYYSLPNVVKISVDTYHNDSLISVATQLKKDLKNIFNITAKINLVKNGKKKVASENEIFLTYEKPLKNKETYRMSIGERKGQGIIVKGEARQGVFWGTRTLLQLVENHENKIPTGNILDYPDFPARGFMLDVGRKFFTIDYLRDYVKILSYYKMNEFHVHLNDNGFKKYYGNDWSKTYSAFRLESETYPGLAAKDGHYTKKEFRDLQLLGMQYGVEVIPEIDIPAHSLAFTQYNPALKANAPYADDHLDILNDEKLPIIYDFFDKLFDEYIKGDNPTFVGPSVHIGTDEFIKEGAGRNVDNFQAKRFREFTNHYLKYIADLGKIPRLWGGLEWLKDKPITKVSPQNGAIMNAWSKDWVNAKQMIEEGFKIISTPDSWLYIVPAAGYYRDFLDTNWIYNKYRPEMVNGTLTLPEFQEGLLGSTFAVWNDICGNGISQLDVHYRTMPALKVIGTKNWKVNLSKNYDEYRELASVQTHIPEVKIEGGNIKKTLNKIESKINSNPIHLNGRKELLLNGANLTYNYQISFDLKPSKGNKENAILFQSDYAKVTLNTEGTGKIGFSRDGYIYTFNFKPLEKVWQNIKIKSDYKSIALYIDGKEFEVLKSYKKMEGMPFDLEYQQTLAFPLDKLGDSKNGYKGYVKNLRIEYFPEIKW